MNSNATAELAAAVKAYAEAARAATARGREPPPAFTPESEVSATDVAIVVDALLRAANLDLFEIQMWRSLGQP